MLEKPISFWENIVSFRKCIQQTGPTDWKHKCVLQNTNLFCQSKQKSVLNQNTFVFCYTPGNCYCICTYCYANNSKYYERWTPPTSAAPSATVSAMLAPPSPLPWLPRCRRYCHCRRLHCRCHCHSCHCLHAATSTVSAAIATACWLIIVCPCAASASATVACPCACRSWLPTPLPLSSQPQTAVPCSFCPNRVMIKILHLK